MTIPSGCSRGAEFVGDIERPRLCNWSGTADVVACHTSWSLMPCIAQVELLRAKLEQANNKNDVLRENYEMLDTKLTQVNRHPRRDRVYRHQLQ